MNDFNYDYEEEDYIDNEEEEEEFERLLRVHGITLEDVDGDEFSPMLQRYK